MNKRKTHQPPERVQQRAALPDELLMVCNDNPKFDRKFAEIFRDVKAARGKTHE